MSAATVNIDDVAVIGEKPPLGRFTAKLLTGEGKQSKNNKPMILPTFVVTKGDKEGTELTAMYSLAATQGKDGRTYARGISDCVSLFAKLGKPLPKGFAFPQDENAAWKLYATKLKGEEVEIQVYEEEDYKGEKDENGKIKVYNRVRVLGPTPKPVAAGAVADSFDFDGD